MVNYCCVYGCGRNSRTHNYLNFYSLPKERHRQIKWLKAASRDDLLNSDFTVNVKSHRICSRHFDPSHVKNKLLAPNAVPTLNLFGDKDSRDDSKIHKGLVCNNCELNIMGFRYKCLTCEDYDLCSRCEATRKHAEHYMIRIPKPIKFGNAIRLTRDLSGIIEKHDTVSRAENSDSESNDDEPITNYLKRKTHENDLTEEVKSKIRREVIRALNVNIETNAEVNKTTENTCIIEETVSDNLNDLLVNYLKKNEILEVEFANVEEEGSSNQIKHEVVPIAEVQVRKMTSPSPGIHDMLSEFLIKNPSK